MARISCRAGCYAASQACRRRRDAARPARDAAVSARQRPARGFLASPGRLARVRPVRAACTRPGIVDGEIIAGQRENVPRMNPLRSRLPIAVTGALKRLLGVRSYHDRNRTRATRNRHSSRTGRAESVLIPRNSKAADLHKLPVPPRSSRFLRGRRKSSGCSLAARSPG
jgi:hypothetical protein